MNQFLETLMRKHLNRFAKSIIMKAHERLIIDSKQRHELASLIDRRLFPEYGNYPRRWWGKTL
jgi:hypothetical protein